MGVRCGKAGGMRPLTPAKILSICAALAAVLFVEVVVSLQIGAYHMSARDIVVTLYQGALGHWDAMPGEFKSVIFGLRLPRIALGILVGAALSTAGAGFQALLRNPLADPYVLGVSSGAALGTIISLIVTPHAAGAMQGGAFIGAFAAVGGVYFWGGRGRDLRRIAFWLMGDLQSDPKIGLRWLYFFLIVAIGCIFTTSSDLNLMLTGEQEARHLGVNVNRVKLVVYICASLLTGLAVSVSGAIGYVGLLVPHVMRMLFGTDYRLLIPTSAIGGAIAIVLADTLARTVVAPSELPVGAMTALAGAPVFIYLMRRRMR